MVRTPAGQTRLDILEWLMDPATHFPPQPHGNPEDGVTADAVAAKLGVPRPVADTHLRLLTALGLLRSREIRRRTHYRRDEARIAEVARMFETGWSVGGRAGRETGPWTVPPLSSPSGTSGSAAEARRTSSPTPAAGC
jgi:ArsR family transcriptional regulator